MVLLWSILSICDLIQYSLGYKNDFRGTGLLGFIEFHRSAPPVTNGNNTGETCDESNNNSTANPKAPGSKKECSTWY